MFTTLIVQPIFNLLVLIYALIPGHNFGLAIILFTILVRLLLWPLVKKQLHHAKAMRALMPEIKKIKAAAKGDRRKESQLTMELYKEREINPFASLGIVIAQIPILIGLYLGLVKLINDPKQIVEFSYPVLQNFAWMKELAADISKFDATLFGAVDLARPALGDMGFYLPAFLLVAASAVAQFFQSRQLMPQSKDARSLRKILSEAGQGNKADQQEVNVAVGRASLYLIPGFVFIIGLNLASALPLYWLVSALAALIQQTIILRDDVQEATTLVRGKEKPAKIKTAPKPKPVLSATEASALRDQQMKATQGASAAKNKKRKRKRRK